MELRKRGKRKPRVKLRNISSALVVTFVAVEAILMTRYRFASSDILQSSDDKLPQWVEDYFRWHTETRRMYPGSELFTNPSAPPLLIRTCLGLCGGLNDRLGQLPWDLYLANQTGRIFLIRWERPRPLEDFLIPNEIDWSIPEGVKGYGDMHAVRAITPFFRDYNCLLYTSPSPRDGLLSRMPSSA